MSEPAVADPPFECTIVGVQAEQYGGSTIVLRSRHTHYAYAVEEMISTCDDQFRGEVTAEQGLDDDEPLVDDLAYERAGESFVSIKVYLGHAPEDDDVSGLELLHEE